MRRSTAAGQNVDIMDVAPFVLETLYEANYEFDNDEIVVIINIGASTTGINVVKGGMSIFTRDFALAGNSITESLQEKYKVTFEEAEKIKIEGIPDGSDGDNSGFKKQHSGFCPTDLLWKLKDPLIISVQLLAANILSKYCLPVDRPEFTT